MVKGEFQPEPFSLEDILRHFFWKHPQISFVCTCFSVQIDVERRALISAMNLRGAYRITGNFFPNPNAEQPISEELKRIVCDFPKQLPNTESGGLNAQNWLYAHPEAYGRSHIGGLTMSDNFVKFSVRALQELLAGRIDQERFFQVHGFVSDGIGPIVRNPFDEALIRGKLIAAMTVESDPDRDDDWVVVRFGRRDPAISKISVPDFRSTQEKGRRDTSHGKV